MHDRPGAFRILQQNLLISWKKPPKLVGTTWNFNNVENFYTSVFTLIRVFIPLFNNL